MSDKAKSYENYINVLVRIRGGCNNNEDKANFKIDSQNISLDSSNYNYDHIAGEFSTQEEIFQSCGKRICDAALEGYNGTIFAYGQTGSGKTYTLLGEGINSHKAFKKFENFPKSKCISEVDSFISSRVTGQIEGDVHIFDISPDKTINQTCTYNGINNNIFLSEDKKRPSNNNNPSIIKQSNENLDGSILSNNDNILSSIPQQIDNFQQNQHNFKTPLLPQLSNKLTDISFSNSSNYAFPSNDERYGLLPRVIYYLFSKMEESKKTYKVNISYLEIYNDSISDLLNNRNKVEMRDIGKEIVVINARKLLIKAPVEAMKYIIQGNNIRHTASTKMNDKSSRSHAVISIYLEKTEELTGSTNPLRNKKTVKSVLHLIDLAGSERQSKTESSGERLVEAGAINKSLHILSRVIESLVKNEKQIPYRDCKLTHFLKDSLGGNSKTSIIATISPLKSNICESISTLRFAQNAKKVLNKAVINEELTASESLAFKLEIKNLKDKYASILAENERLKNELNDRSKKPYFSSMNQNSIKTLSKKGLGNNNKSQENSTKIVEQYLRNLEEKNKKLEEIMELNEELKNEKERLELEVQDKEAEIMDCKNEYNDLNAKYRALEKEKGALLSELNKIKNDNIILSEKLTSKNKLYEQNLSINENYIKDMNKLIEEKDAIIKKKDIEHNNIFQELKAKYNEINELNTLITQKSSMIQELENSNYNLKKDYEILSRKLENSNEVNKQLTEKLSANNNKISNLTEVGNKCYQKYNDVINELTEKNKNLWEEMQKQSKEHEIEKGNQILISREERLRLETELSRIKEDRQQFLYEISKYNEKIRISEAAYEELKSELDELKETLQYNEIDYNYLLKNLNPNKRANKYLRLNEQVKNDKNKSSCGYSSSNVINGGEINMNSAATARTEVLKFNNKVSSFNTLNPTESTNKNLNARNRSKLVRFDNVSKQSFKSNYSAHTTSEDNSPLRNNNLSSKNSAKNIIGSNFNPNSTHSNVNNLKHPYQTKEKVKEELKKMTENCFNYKQKYDKLLSVLQKKNGEKKMENLDDLIKGYDEIRKQNKIFTNLFFDLFKRIKSCIDGEGKILDNFKYGFTQEQLRTLSVENRFKIIVEKYIDINKAKSSLINDYKRQIEFKKILHQNIMRKKRADDANSSKRSINSSNLDSYSKNRIKETLENLSEIKEQSALKQLNSKDKEQSNNLSTAALTENNNKTSQRIEPSSSFVINDTSSGNNSGNRNKSKNDENNWNNALSGINMNS